MEKHEAAVTYFALQKEENGLAAVNMLACTLKIAAIVKEKRLQTYKCQIFFYIGVTVGCIIVLGLLAHC